MNDRMVFALPNHAEIRSGLQERSAARQGQGAAAAARPRPTPTPLERELLAEAERAVRAVRDTLGAPTSIGEARDALAATLQSAAFARFRELVDQHGRASETDRTFSIKALTFGFTVIGSVILGAEGSFGVGVPPGNWDDTSEYVMYVTISAEEGLGEEIVAGLALGIYDVEPTELEGTTYGFSIDLGFDVDVEAQSWSRAQDGTNLLGVTAIAGLGEGIEVDALESYTWILNWDAPYVYQEPAPNYMILQSITCNKTGESGHDELYFTFQPDTTSKKYTYPTRGYYSIADGEVWNCGRSIYFRDQVTVSLWDSDSTGSDDPRGSTTYHASSFQSSVQVSDNSGQYTLHAVLNPVPPPWGVMPRINNVDTSAQTPGACVFNGSSYVFWKGQGNQAIYYSASSSGIAPWPNGATINNVDVTNSGPSAIAYDGELFVFFCGTNGGVYWTASSDGASWPSASAIPGQSTPNTPIPCVFNDTLYVFWMASNSSKTIFYSSWSSSSRSWSQSRAIANTYATAPVAPCVFNGRLYLYYSAMMLPGMPYLFVTSLGSDGTWSAPIAFALVYADSGPAACAWNGKVYLFYSGNLNCEYLTSSDGMSFQAPGVASGVPALDGTSLTTQVFNNQIYLFLTNSSNQVCFAAGTP